MTRPQCSAGPAQSSILLQVISIPSKYDTHRARALRAGWKRSRSGSGSEAREGAFMEDIAPPAAARFIGSADINFNAHAWKRVRGCPLIYFVRRTWAMGGGGVVRAP